MTHQYPGKFITLEGIEGVGKSTQLKYLQQWFSEKNIPIVVTREPGGDPVSERIRAIFLEKITETIMPDTELLLLFAARSQHLETVIFPALKRGQWVICDRFTDASYAYQGGGRNISSERIAILESWVQGNFQPDLTLLLDAPVDLALSRVKRRGGSDRIEVENQDFFTRVRNCYLERANKYDRYRIVDPTQSMERIQQQLSEILSKFLQGALDV
jgi:dTMP kinase